MENTSNELSPIKIPEHFDYIGVYLTNRCFLSCDYCITNHNDVFFINNKTHGKELNLEEWVVGLNRLEIKNDIPITLQGGEPFMHKGIWGILEQVRHKMDILTALPKNVTPDSFRALSTLDWNKRSAPYPTIRVSYHKNQNDYKDLIPRIAELQEIVSIGLFHIDHPGYPEETEKIRKMADQYKIDFRLKEYLGWYDGKMYGTYLYPEAVLGEVVEDKVLCKNTVVPIGPLGYLYRCHSDLYHQRHNLAIANILTDGDKFVDKFRPCSYYGMCSECDVKVKNNHQQVFGYTSVQMIFPNRKVSESAPSR